jgi:histidyl-tRNA synthetase
MSTTAPQTLKGFRDFLGADARKRRWLMDKIRVVFERFGFEPLETPTLEYESLLLGKYGAEADKLIFGFEDRGGRRVALRYDQTVPTARIVAQYRNQLTLPYKRYQIQPVWRADKPQKGRYREFTQCDADIIGSNSRLADAEILAIYASIYLEIAISSIKIKVNDRQQLITTIKNTGVSEEQVFNTIQTIDKLDKKTQEEVIEELVSKGLEKEKAHQLIQQLNTGTMSESLQSIIDQAVQLGIPRDVFVYSPTLARGLDYYTGMIFEGIIPEYTVGSVGGGGRYDNLINDLVGVDMPAVGFGLGFDRTLEAAQELGKIPDFKASAQVLVTVMPEYEAYSLKAAAQLRKAGISSEIFLEDKKLDKQMKYALAKGIPCIMFIGDNEVKQNLVKLKDLETREEKEVEIEEVIRIMSKL